MKPGGLSKIILETVCTRKTFPNLGSQVGKSPGWDAGEDKGRRLQKLGEKIYRKKEGVNREQSCQIQEQEAKQEQTNKNPGQLTEQKSKFGFTNQDIVDGARRKQL